MSRYTDEKADRSNTGAAVMPKFCEIPGCQTLLIPRPGEKPLHKCGKADVIVKDRFGNPRGICCEHYSKIANEHGDLPLQHLRNRDGDYSIDKIKAHWDDLDHGKLVETTRILPPIAAKGLGSVLDQLDIQAPTSDDEPPAWWSERP